MNIDVFHNPIPSQWPSLCLRCRTHDVDISTVVSDIIDDVRLRGDQALRDISLRIDGFAPVSLALDRDKISEAEGLVSPQVKAALKVAKANIEAFHRAQLPAEVKVMTIPGVMCVQRPVPIQRVGLYIPGGRAPLFSTVLMLAVPAKLAGCKQLILCTPMRNDGSVCPEIVYAAKLCGVDMIFGVGGAQAIAAMALGTQSIPKVDKIFGPGNRFVTTAKQMLGSTSVAIDMPAGPSEVMVVADNRANPAYVAADLLSQAEHGDDSQSILVCESIDFADAVNSQVHQQAACLSRSSTICRSLQHSRIIVFSDADFRSRALEFVNLYAPEHLILALDSPWQFAQDVVAVGSVFVGPYSPESAGDYASGTNHTLPTNGWARSYSGVNIDSFMRKITYQEISRDGLRSLAPTIDTMARAEGLDAHANAVNIRTKGGLL